MKAPFSSKLPGAMALCLILGLLLLFSSGAAAAPVVVNIRVDDIGHSSARITWDSDIQSVNQRVQYGTTAAYGVIQGTYQQATVTTNQQMLLTGLAPNTQYHFCAQSTTDNIVWSDCADQVFTTLPLPAVHPEPPAAPATFDTSMPMQAGATYTVGGDCLDSASGLQHFLNVAVPGDTITIPTTTTNCNGQFITPSGVGSKQLEGLSANTLTVTSHGYTNGQIVRLGGTFGTPAGTSAGIDYYVIGATANTFQLSRTPNGSPVAMTNVNPQMRVMAWPPVGNWIVIRTAQPDSELPPEGVRVNPSWSAKLALLTSTETGHSVTAPAIAFGTLAHHYRFVGLEITHAQTATPDVFDPLDHAPYAYTTADTSYVIFDRCYFHGLGFPDRIWHGFFYWNGAFLAIINSYADNQDYWRPYASGLNITSDSNANTLTVATGTYHTGYTDCRVTSPVTLTITGGAASGTGQMWMTGDCGIVADFPSGMLANCSICSVVTETNPVLPKNNKNEYTVVPLGIFTLAAGRFTGARRYFSYELSAWNTEGSQFLTIQYGPGPYILDNNYIQGVGILTHFTDEGLGVTVPSDITVTRNVFESPLEKMAFGPANDGRAYSHRNAFEVKTGQRIRFEGNQVVANFQEVTPNGYAAIFVVNAAFNPGLSNNVTSDLVIRNNTIDQSSSGIQINGATPQSYQVGKNMRRVLVENNLFKRIDGRKYSANYLSGATLGAGGVVLSTAHGGEDFVIRHNTAYINRGPFPCFFCPYARPMEGFVMRDNIFWVNGDSGYRGVQFSGTTDSASSPVCPTIGKAALDCIMTSGPGNPSYTWANNVLVPGLLTTGAGGIGDAGNLTGIGALYAASPGTLVVAGATPQARETAVQFSDSAGGNFTLALGSPYKAAGSDGADPGYDGFALDAAQGVVKETVVTAGAGQAVVKFTAPDGVGCPVDVSANNFQTWTRTGDPGGKRNRQIVIDSLSAATTYAYRILCRSMQVTGNFLTKPSGGAATNMPLSVKPPASFGVDHVVVQSGPTHSLGSATAATPCTTGCTVLVPGTTAQVLYYSVQLFDAANSVLAASPVQAAVPQ